MCAHPLANLDSYFIAGRTLYAHEGAELFTFATTEEAASALTALRRSVRRPPQRLNGAACQHTVGDVLAAFEAAEREALR